MSTLAAALERSRRAGRAGFVPFLAAGDPSLKATALFARSLEHAGADLLELGVPFSDPVADGPVIQAASQRALKAGATLAKVLELAAGLSGSGFRAPIILFTYLNPVLRMGLPVFARRCAESGVRGVLIVDLCAEESQAVYAPLRKRGVEPVLLASPTTSDARLRLIGRLSGSVVYYVSREGVTGARRGLAPGLSRRLARVRRLTGKPLLVGFGVSEPAQARALAPLADGVVVGSALVAAAAKGRGLPLLARRLVAGLSLRGR